MQGYEKEFWKFLLAAHDVQASNSGAAQVVPLMVERQTIIKREPSLKAIETAEKGLKILALGPFIMDEKGRVSQEKYEEVKKWVKGIEILKGEVRDREKAELNKK